MSGVNVKARNGEVLDCCIFLHETIQQLYYEHEFQRFSIRQSEIIMAIDYNNYERKFFIGAHY